MKSLVVFYSRTGKTKEAGKAISLNLKSDIDEIIDDKSRKGIFGWLGGGRDALREKLTKIRYKKNPIDYDLVVIGTPVWAGRMTPAIRTYLSKNKFKSIAFFCTCGGNKGKTFDEMEILSNKPIAVLELSNRKKSGVREFCSKLKSKVI